jgi:hypothetical protein
MKSVVLSLLLVSAPVFAAQDETDLAKGGGKADAFQYGLSSETYETCCGQSVTDKWASVHSGHLTVGIDQGLHKYRMRLNTNGGDLLGIQNTAAGKNLLNKLQIEAGAATGNAAYGLWAFELPAAKPVALFVGSVHNPGGAQRFIAGPIYYWGHSTSMLLYYPKGQRSDSVVKNAFVLRNRIRESTLAWVDLDATYKMVGKEEQVDSFQPLGYSVAVGAWKVYGKYGVTPYYQGQNVQKTSYELGVDAAF